MENTVTVEQAFAVAITAEQAVEMLFRGLEIKFAPYAEVASFWREYAHEETLHARWLQSARARLTPEQLTAQVPAEIVANMRLVADFSVEKALGQVKNLEEAYDLVTELENGETNALFSFLLDHFEPDEQTGNFIRAQLNSHIVKLVTGLPAKYQSGEGFRAVKAVA